MRRVAQHVAAGRPVRRSTANAFDAHGGLGCGTRRTGRATPRSPPAAAGDPALRISRFPDGYVDASRSELVDGFIRKTLTAMIEGIREPAIAAGLIDANRFAVGDSGPRTIHRSRRRVLLHHLQGHREEMSDQMAVRPRRGIHRGRPHQRRDRLEVAPPSGASSSRSGSPTRRLVRCSGLFPACKPLSTRSGSAGGGRGRNDPWRWVPDQQNRSRIGAAAEATHVGALGGRPGATTSGAPDRASGRVVAGAPHRRWNRVTDPSR